MSAEEDALRWEGDEIDRIVDDPDAAESNPDPDTAAGAAGQVGQSRRWGALGWLMLALALAATVGWIVVVIANPVEQPSLLGVAMYQLGELLAVIAPLLWWFAVARVAQVDRRAPWWVAGMLVTAPWPLVAGVFA